MRLIFKLDVLDEMKDEERLKYMLILASGQMSSEKNDLANISNVTGIIKACVKDLNWAGFYFLRDEELVLGPFQGLPACNRILPGKGVCGKAVETRQNQLVADVELFPGHIACDSQSQSELVIPIIKDGQVFGVLDLDSPSKDRFTELEEKYFSKLVEKLNQFISWENI